MSRPQRPDAQTYMAHMTHVLSVIGSPDYPPDPQRLQQRLHGLVLARLPPGRHGAPAGGGGGRRRPLAAAAPHRRAHARDPRRGRSAGAGAGRARPGAARSPAPWPTSCPAWATTCRCRCCRASPKGSRRTRRARRPEPGCASRPAWHRPRRRYRGLWRFEQRAVFRTFELDAGCQWPHRPGLAGLSRMLRIEVTLLQQANATVINLTQPHEAKLSRWHIFKDQL